MTLTSNQIEILSQFSTEELKNEVRRRNLEERKKLGLKKGPKYTEFEGVVIKMYERKNAFRKNEYNIRSDAFGENKHFEYHDFLVCSTFFRRKSDMPHEGDTVKLRVLNGRLPVDGKIIEVIKRAEK